ncbi:PepSY domain-containing protein [Qipengyuania thermophila]|uniref:PepSY domain-containing protein n=1 Tax=Qipengyuania thermophila TaxID=2509361 RepID=UPI001F1FDBEE|nr:PepSY domain-containing protein [Qipengyuania thermophila]
MRRLARWHIWLGWLVAVPLLLWTLSGLVMVSRPIEEVRGEHLRAEGRSEILPAGEPLTLVVPAAAGPVAEATVRVQHGQTVVLLRPPHGPAQRYRLDGAPLPGIDEAAARAIAAQGIRGGREIVSARLFPADSAPLDFRRPMPAWQVRFSDGTRVYVGEQTGAIEAIRTRFWRVFDIMWGLHIMDLRGREATHHPVLIVFAALAFVAVLVGTALLFRRRARSESARP